MFRWISKFDGMQWNFTQADAPLRGWADRSDDRSDDESEEEPGAHGASETPDTENPDDQHESGEGTQSASAANMPAEELNELSRGAIVEDTCSTGYATTGKQNREPFWTQKECSLDLQLMIKDAYYEHDASEQQKTLVKVHIKMCPNDNYTEAARIGMKKQFAQHTLVPWMFVVGGLETGTDLRERYRQMLYCIKEEAVHFACRRHNGKDGTSHHAMARLLQVLPDDDATDLGRACGDRAKDLFKVHAKKKKEQGKEAVAFSSSR